MSNYEGVLKDNFRMILKGQIGTSGKSIRQVAKEAKLNYDTVRNLLNNNLFEPTADTVNSVCNAIGFDVEKLFKEELRVE